MAVPLAAIVLNPELEIRSSSEFTLAANCPYVQPKVKEMILKSIEYIENKGLPEEWQVSCILNDINLMAGRNATGKTRTLNLISSLTNLLAGDFRPTSDHAVLTAEFELDETTAKYETGYEDGRIVREELVEDNKLLLQRGREGFGKIFANKLDAFIDFQPPSDELALAGRRDAIQHPFLSKYYEWGKSARHFRFGTPMGQDHLAVFRSDIAKKETDLKNTNQVVGIFHKGDVLFGDRYSELIIEDMKKIGYDLEAVSLQEMSQVSAADVSEGARGLRIKEKGLNVPTSHHYISMGMFRALSLIIQINYSLLDLLPSCIIIDDIGEGLDYGRSTDLIRLLIEKVRGTNIQIVMSSNDRFVMNSVPLEYWSVIRRLPNKSVVYNYHNSKEIFDEFEFAGLSNFDFFTSNYLLKEEPGQVFPPSVSG